MENLKRCNRCRTFKPTSKFHKCKGMKDDLRSLCKMCTNARNRRYYEENREKCLTRNKHNREKNPEKHRALTKRHRDKNLEYMRALGRRHYKENRTVYRIKVAKRRAAKLKRLPSWLTEYDHKRIRLRYASAKKKRMHVDHIVPLQGKHVSGLHVPGNLHVCDAEINLSKNNNFDPETQGQDVHKHLIGKRWSDL